MPIKDYIILEQPEDAFYEVYIGSFTAGDNELALQYLVDRLIEDGEIDPHTDDYVMDLACESGRVIVDERNWTLMERKEF